MLPSARTRSLPDPRVPLLVPLRASLLVALTALLTACGQPADEGASSKSSSSNNSNSSNSPPTPVMANLPNVLDRDVTEHVKTALQSSPTLKGFDIQVQTLQGDVRLTGVLDSQEQVVEALRIARASEGAHSIHDELTLKTP